MCVCSQLHWSDLKEETESTYSVHTLKDTTPLRSTGPFVYDAPSDVLSTDNERPAPAASDDADSQTATVGVSAVDALY